MQAQDSEIIKVEFEVIKIRHRNDDNGFTIFEAKFKHYPSDYLPTSEIVVIGNFMSIFVEDEFEGEGFWQNDKTFGYNFRLKWNRRIVPQSKKGIIEFLKRFGKGIGLGRAKRIVEEFGTETISVIENDWERLTQIPGVGKKLALKLHDKIVTHKKYEEVAMFVLGNGFGYKIALRIYEAYGEGSIIKIKENPYCLSGVKKVGFLTADKFAKNLGYPFNYIKRIKEGLIYFLDFDSRKNGNLFIYKNDLLKEFSVFLDKYGAYNEGENKKKISEKNIKTALEELAREEKIIIVSDEKEGEYIYLKKFFCTENKIVELLKKLINEPKEPICTKEQIEQFVTNFENKNGFKFAKKQQEAVFMALSNGISILTGGPGTGKTQTINSIIQCIKSVKPHAIIHLCAPTGKASKRMTELTHMNAQTIHRLIGLNGFDEDNVLEKVEGDYLIVDESSMIDAYVFYKLLDSIDENTRVLFVGDYEQLPSVGAGLILRDLINSHKIPTTTLDEIFRQAKESQIVMNSHKIIKGKKTVGDDSLTFDEKKGDFYFVERNDRCITQKCIIKSVENWISKGKYRLSDIQILTPMRKGDLGVYTLNRLMQQTFNPPCQSKQELKVDETTVYRIGDKVIQTINNYDLGVFNGEVGIVNLIYYDDNDDLAMEVDFGDKTIIYDELSAEELMLAYAITVHKSQGSEFPVIIIPIHNSQQNMLNKNLIYTGWTRARDVVVTIGQKSALDAAIDRTDNTVRNSKIKEKIINEIL